MLCYSVVTLDVVRRRVDLRSQCGAEIERPEPKRLSAGMRVRKLAQYAFPVLNASETRPVLR